MRITIGIDPSVAHTGICRLIDGREDAVLELPTPAGLPRPERLIMARENIRAFLQFKIPTEPLHVALEGEAWMAHGMVDTAAIQATCQVLLWEMRSQWRRAQWPPLRFLPVNISWLKKWVDAKEKQHVLMRVLKQYDREFTNDNMADAFVLAKIADAYAQLQAGTATLKDFSQRQQEVLTKLVCPWEVAAPPPKVRKKRKSHAP